MKRLEEASHEDLRKLCDADGPLACGWCAKCDCHYRFCKCDKPEWKLRANGVLHPLPGQPGGPIRLSDLFG